MRVAEDLNLDVHGNQHFVDVLEVVIIADEVAVKSLEQAALHIEDLYALEDEYVPARSLLIQLDAREQAGAACHTVALESIRLARFLKTRR